MQRFVNNASSIPIIDGARIIKTNHLIHQELINSSNPLVQNSVDAVRDHVNSKRLLTAVVIKTYLASSVLLHNLDGWGYLSNAIDSLLKGDNSVSIHLGYYGELRASMSFLAAEGIGIFNTRHISVDASNTIIPNPGLSQTGRGGRTRTDSSGNPILRFDFGTHQFVWDSLEKLVISPSKPNNNILKVFSVNSKTFDEWANAFPFPASATGNVIIKKWLRKWNSDVQFFRNDRDTRNDVSYKPQRLTNVPNQFSVNQIIDKLTSFWELMEPDNSNRFQNLDKYLLRMFIQELYNSLSATLKRTYSLETVIKDTISALGLNHDISLIDFLKNTQPISHDLFVQANSIAFNAATRSLNPLSVIARATLMLRFSTGTTNLILQSAGINKAELDFLWERYGVENGFWAPGNLPATFNSLYDDIKDDIEEVNSWATGNSPNLSLSQIFNHQSIPLSFIFFAQFHRAGLWGITL